MTLPEFPEQSTDVPLWRRRWAGPAIVASVFLAMLVWTWQKWADVLVDFAVQLYVPWQLSLGKVLYRDIAHYTGPLSVYYNALAFRVFGANLHVLELANLPVLIGIVIVVYYLGGRLGGRLCATVCAISFLILFAFAHLTVAGNYNYVCPYEYEYTHATLLSLLCVITLGRMVQKCYAANAGAAGLLAGIIFLTRAEFFVAIMAAGTAALGILVITDWRKSLPAAGIFIAAMVIPPLASAGLLSLAMPWSEALHGTMGMWPALIRGNVSVQHFYQHSMGLDDLGLSMRLLLAWLIAWCIPTAALAAWSAVPGPRRSMITLAAAFALGAVVAGWQWRHRDWASMFRPLPVLVATVIVIALVKSRRNPKQAALPAILGIFSLVLMAKVFLYARIIHYGCWLAMPATLLLVITVFAWIPAGIRKIGGCPGIFVSGMAGVWTVVLLVHLAITHTAIKRLTVSVGSGPDQFWADAERGPCVNNAVEAARQIIPPDKTLACFPEGIMINYLARLNTSTPYVNFNPPDLLLFGEDRMLEALKRSSPDYVFLVHKDTSEFGERFFGRDYGQNIYAWIQARYREQPLPMLYLGAEPLQGAQFGIRLLIPRPSDEGQRRLIYGPSGAAGIDSIAADSTSVYR
jgi:hypothetical protein